MGSAFCRPYYDIKGAACGLSMSSGVLGAKEMMSHIDGLVAVVRLGNLALPRRPSDILRVFFGLRCCPAPILTLS